MDVMELAGRLALQHAQEPKEVLRLEGDRANQARIQLQALAQALHHILSTSTSGGEGEERGRDGAAAMEEEVETLSAEEVRWLSGGHWLLLRSRPSGSLVYGRLRPGQGWRAADPFGVCTGTAGGGPGWRGCVLGW
jgi:hypothetical protein